MKTPPQAPENVAHGDATAVTGLVPVREATGRQLAPYRASEYQRDLAAREDGTLLERLALSENPFGCSPLAEAAVTAEIARLNRYPDSSCWALRQALSRHHGVDSDQIIVGNGADEILAMAAQTFAHRGRTAVCNEHTYFCHFAALRLTNAPVMVAPLGPDRIDVAALIRYLPQASVAFVCNPHNPTGTALGPGAVRKLVAACAASDCTLVLDEAYADYARKEHWGSGLAHVEEGRVLVVRTFSKAYGLAGLRIGYAIGHRDLIERLSVTRHATPFSVNRLGLAAALAALADQPFLASVVERTRAVRDSVATSLRSAGRCVRPSETNFVLIEVPGMADLACQRLRDDFGIHARPCGPLGLPSHMRLGVCRERDVPRIVAALREVLDDVALLSGANGDSKREHRPA